MVEHPREITAVVEMERLKEQRADENHYLSRHPTTNPQELFVVGSIVRSTHRESLTSDATEH